MQGSNGGGARSRLLFVTSPKEEKRQGSRVRTRLPLGPDRGWTGGEEWDGAQSPTSVRPKGQPSTDAGALAFSSFGIVTNNSRDRAPPPSLPCIVPPPLETRRPTLRHTALPGSTSAADF